MPILRRELLEGVLASTALAACGSSTSATPRVAGGPLPAPTGSGAPPAASKRVLILGGTGFVGPPIVEAALRRGHTVTLFNRNKTHPGLFKDIETIVGDRMTQLDLLKGRAWDTVIDTWAKDPSLVGKAADLLRDQVGHYLFVSTISVYKLGRGPIDEASPVLPLPAGVDLASAKVDENTYGPLKVLAEQAAERAFPGRATSVRAGLIAGPGDTSARFTYWPLRVARGGEMIAPGAPDDRMQFIDVRDLGEWMVTVVERGVMGVYNAVGPDKPFIGATLDEVKAAVPSDVRLTWIDQAWLDQNEVGGWNDFPIAVPSNADDCGFGKVSAARAIAQGLRFRAPRETAGAALAWWNARPEELRAKKRPGMSPERETEILQRWHKARG
jgi:2'-hydroxyisoflavone reductase